jgi:CRISPR-associated endonuclease/helicase Cas3
MPLYARTGGPHGRQLLSEHLAHVAEIAGCFADDFRAGQWARAAGLLHDRGKASEEFQDKLDGAPQRVDHSTAGAQIAVKIFERAGKLIAACIAGHHGGLADGKSGRDSCLASRLKRERIPKLIAHDEFVMPGPIGKLPIMVESGKTERLRLAFQVSFFVRMLFSCLVDADRLDSELFTNPERAVYRKGYPEMAELEGRFSAEMRSFLSRSSNKPINIERRKVLEACLSKADETPGLFSLTVPTGGGKTRSSLGFALRHAVTHGLKRIIYVIPFMSIIEQNADVFRGILGNGCVLEHHSAFDLTRMSKQNSEESLEYQRFELAAENWDAPLIVTTGVQFFESLFSSHPSRCRKLHNIAKSVVILDEAQMMPVELLLPCLEAIRELTVSYGTSVVLCTATQPALGESPEFKFGLDGVREIISNPKDLYSKLRRVKIQHAGKLTKDELCQRVRAYEQALCIVNTRREARDIFDGVGKVEGAYHLSALMCPEHRSLKIEEIRNRLINNLPCRVVSTRLIEAGVDIDFPVVFRALGGIDSIAQAGGRCNREGKFDKGVLLIFELQDTELPVPFRAPVEVAAEIMRKYPSDPLCLDAVEDYFRMLYWRAGERLDSKQILTNLAESLDECFFPFEKISEKFRMIEGEGEPILIPYDKNARSVIAALRYAEFPGRFLRKGQRYSVQIFPHDQMKLEDLGAVECIQGNYWALTEFGYDSFYSDEVGLKITDPGGKFGALIF